MPRMLRSPFGGEEESRSGTDVHTEDGHPRSLPEDRSEGNLNPDPVLECGMCLPEGHSPSGEVGGDDGAGNLSPRAEAGPQYGLDDVDGLEMGGDDWSAGPAG